VVILGLDTATPSTVAGLLLPEGRVVEARDDPAPGERPAHASRLLDLAESVLSTADASWDDVHRIAVGVGPGSFTGLRIGVATARGLAQARGIPLVPVSTLRALALPAHDGSAVAAVIDARRREVFAAVYAADGSELVAPAAFAPADLAPHLDGVLAVGDGAVLYREVLGGRVPDDGDPRHRVTGEALCRLGADGGSGHVGRFGGIASGSRR
jgi:tRNA threonylcarbamoyladenosine biosynthesis protein TsaB